MQLTATLATLMATLASVVSAKDSRTFAVLRFHGDGPLTQGRSDPIVSPGTASAHVHTIQGGNAFGNSATGESMLESTCSTADIAADKSAYWMPSLYFHDTNNGSFEPVPLFYMNVYYFFEATNDNITAFPVGLQMVSGDASKKTAPATGNDILDPSEGTIQPAQFTCPRSSYDPPSYPVGSNGSMAGIQDTGNKGAGAGFPFAECDGYASPLRADLHFPSCYDPEAELTSYRSNMQFPTDAGDGKQDCPAGWLHTPHIFYEMYWNTPLFADRWTPNDGSQPFVLSNGDAAGFSLHGDFLAAWDTDVLQHIIDTCDAGDAGMDQCPGVETVLKGDCSIANPTPEDIGGSLAALPGSNSLFGWQYGTGSGETVSAAAAGTVAEAGTTSTTAKTTAKTTVKATAATTASSASSASASTSTSTAASLSSGSSSSVSPYSATSAAAVVVGAVIVPSASTGLESAVSSTSSSSSPFVSSSVVDISATAKATTLATRFSSSSLASSSPLYANTTSTVYIVIGSASTKSTGAFPTFAAHHHYTNSSVPAAATATAGGVGVVVGAAAAAAADATYGSSRSSSGTGCGSLPTTTVTLTATPTTTLTTTVYRTTTTTGTLVPSGAALFARQEHIRRHKRLHY